MKKALPKYSIFATVVLVVFLLFGCSSQLSETEFNSAADLTEARIAVMTGSTGEQLALIHFPEADIKSFDDMMDAVTALLSGQVDAVLSGYPTVHSVTRYNSNVYYLEEAIAYEDTCVAVKKGNEELLTQVNTVIAALKESGELERIIGRWYKTDLSPYDPINLILPTEGEELRVGVNATREPTSFLDADGNFSGMDAEIAYHIAIALNQPVKIYDMNFSALIPALQAGKIDLIVTGMSATPERRQSVDFSEPYFANRQVLMLKQPVSAKGLELQTLEDIADKRVGVYTGTIYDQYAQDNFPAAVINRYNSTSDMIVALKSNKIDVAFFAQASALVALKSNPDLGILSEDVLDLPLGVGFSKDNAELRLRFNQFLSAAVADGSKSELYARWFENDPEDADMPEFDFSSGTEKVILGVAVGDLPYVAYQDGRYIGHDVELLSRFAAAEMINLEIITMEFSALVPALASGKVDIIADGIAITEERSLQIDFSDPYAINKTAVIALKSNLATYSPEQPLQALEDGFFGSLKTSFYRNLIVENRYQLIIEGLKTTALISILSAIFGTLLGALICFMRMSTNFVFNSIARAYISLLRGIPSLVLLMLIFYVVFASVNISPLLVAVVAFGMNFAAYVSEMFRSAILSIDKGQHEAGIAGGFTTLQTFIYIVMPQAVSQVLPVYKGEFISMVKMTSVVGYIAVQDLTKAGDIIRSRTFDAFFPLIMVAVLYYLISWLLTLSLDYLAFKTDNRARRDRQAKRSNLKIQPTRKEEVTL